jgi:hypothetical protein
VSSLYDLKREHLFFQSVALCPDSAPGLAVWMLISKAKGAIMKPTLIRTLAIALLATSISAFAKTDKAMPDDATAPSNVMQHDNSKQKANDPDKHGKSTKSQGEDQEQQEQDQLLMGTYG